MKLVRMLSLALVLAACGADDGEDSKGGDVAGDGDGDGAGDGDGDGAGDGDGDGAGDGDGDGAGAASCATRSCHVPELYTCYQWTGDDASNAAFCEQLGGSPTDGACPTENAVAGCKTASPFGGEGCAVNWGYAPGIAAEDVQADCDERGGELVR